MGDFFEQDITLLGLRIPKRLFVPLLTVLVAKLVGAAFLYFWLNVGTQGTFWSDPTRVFDLSQNQIFLQTPQGAKWPFLFMGWDSAWYLNIVTYGYGFSGQAYTFSPGFPLAGWLVNGVVQNGVAALALAGLVFGLVWVPLFQLLAEQYVSKQQALLVTLLAAFSPYLFLFTTVAYAEGLLLVFSLGAWLFLCRDRFGWAAVLAFGAALTRVTGVLMVLPMFYEALKAKAPDRGRKLLLSLAPVLGLLTVYGYGFLSSGDLLAPVHTTEWSSLYTMRTFIMHDLPTMGLSAFGEIPFQNGYTAAYWLSPTAITLSLLAPLVLIVLADRLDRKLSIYALGGYLGILVFGAVVSFPRFVSVLFPLWLPFAAKLSGAKRSVAVVAGVVAVFFIVALQMWMEFLNGWFIA